MRRWRLLFMEAKTLTQTVTQIRTHLEAIFGHGVKAVDPFTLITQRFKLDGSRLSLDALEGPLSLNLDDFNEIIVIGGGKASASMARAMEHVLGDRVGSGLVCVKYGHTAPLRKIELVEASHPIPDDQGVTAALRILDIARQATEKTLVIVLVSGGGSALLPAPVPGLTLEEVQHTTQLLLESGADINAINCIRKHLSALKGGRLAKALEGATVLNVVLSDVAGDDLSTIASGLCAPDYTSYNDAAMLLQTYDIINKIPFAVAEHIRKGQNGLTLETPGADDPCFKKVHNVILAGNADAVQGCATKAQELGYHCQIQSRFYNGEAWDVGRSLYALAVDMDKNTPYENKPLCIICGGEATVTLSERYGKGGRAMEVALCFLIQAQKGQRPPYSFLAASTDGNDGPTDAAGAFCTPEIIAAMRANAFNPETFQQSHDTYTFFKALGGLLLTGPTNTNVCDVGIIIIP